MALDRNQNMGNMANTLVIKIHMLTALCPNVASSVEEVNRWMREYFSPDGLKVLICDQLADFASKAGNRVLILCIWIRRHHMQRMSILETAAADSSRSFGFVDTFFRCDCLLWIAASFQFCVVEYCFVADLPGQYVIDA